MSARIRLAGEEDAAAIAAIYAPEVLETSITFEIEPPSVDEMRRRIADTLRQHPWLACERDGEVRGYAYATTHRTRAAYRWAVDVSVYLHHEARGRGARSRSPCSPAASPSSATSRTPPVRFRPPSARAR